MARPPTKIGNKPVHFTFSQPVREKLDRISKAAQLSKSEFLEELICDAEDAAEKQETIAHKKAKNCFDKIKQALGKKKKA